MLNINTTNLKKIIIAYSKGLKAQLLTIIGLALVILKGYINMAVTVPYIQGVQCP